MAKSLRYKLANMALCCTVITGTISQSVTVLANENKIQHETLYTDNDQISTTTGSALEVAQKTTSAALDIQPVAQDPWESIVSSASHKVSINILHETQNKSSMSASYFEKSNIPARIENGKVHLTLKVYKDSTFFSNVIKGLNLCNENGCQALELDYLEDNKIRYITTEVILEDIEEDTYIQCKLEIPFMGSMQPKLRIQLTEESKKYFKELLDQERIDPLKMTVTHVDETIYKAEDGRIAIQVVGGSGKYEYTIDGGENWNEESTFENLEPGIYKVGAKDRTNLDAEVIYQDITIQARENLVDPWVDIVSSATHTASINVLHETKDENSMAADFFEKGMVPAKIRNGKIYLTLKIDKDGLGFKNVVKGFNILRDGVYEPLEVNYLDNDEIRYITTEVMLEDIQEDTYMQCKLELPFASMQPALRIQLSAESIEYFKPLLGLTKPEGLEVTVTPTNETAYKANDGKIIIEAAGGSGNYEYTINGGTTWSTESTFENLAPGNYKVGVKDIDKTDLETVYQEVTIEAKGNLVLPKGTYTVDIDVLHETANKPSMAAAFFDQEALEMVVEKEQVILALNIKKDGMGQTDAIKVIEQKVGEEFVNVPLEHLDDESIRYVIGKINLENVEEAAYVKCHYMTPMGQMAHVLRIRLTDETIQKLKAEIGEVTQSLKMDYTATHETAFGAEDGTINLQVQGGSGAYEYTIDGGANWQAEPTFEGLKPGTYSVGARDQANNNVKSSLEEVVIQGKSQGVIEGLVDGDYSVDIEVLHETNNETSMAAQFFTQTNLPLAIVNGKPYLTIQVKKDGMGMKDVITSLEQKVGGNYQSLHLSHLDDAQKRYITTEVEFESVDDVVYLRCGIAPMLPMKPVLRLRLVESSIKPGAGQIDTSLVANEKTAIQSVVAENGKVTITLTAEDKSLTANDFIGRVYLDGSKEGTLLTLKDFKMEGTQVSFTYDEIEAKDKEQKVQIGITFNQEEISSNVFVISGLKVEVKLGFEIKEDAQNIRYIKGYEDHTFRPNEKVTKAETIAMLAKFIDAPEKDYQTASIDVLHKDKNEASMAKQFFKTDDIMIEKVGQSYEVHLEIENEGLGFTNIITGVWQQVGKSYEPLVVEKSADLKKAYVVIKTDSLKDPITLKTGIAPMGDMAPELRIVIDQKTLRDSEYRSQYEDIDMWAKEEITLFEQLGLIGEEKATLFNPNVAITRGEFVKIIAQITRLNVEEVEALPFKDIEASIYKNYIIAATEAGYINGYDDGEFKPEENLTRAQVVKVINKVMGHDQVELEEKENTFKDLSESHWAYEDILKAVE